MKIISIIGARPQFIKCAPVSRELRKEHKEILVHTGQHYDSEMDRVFFKDLNLPEPDYHLGIGSGLHGVQTGKMLIAIEKVLLKEKPDLVLVYGDTNSTLAGALASVKLHIPIGHVEAGLRSYDRTMPEEINRVLTDHSSDILFCPTKTAVNNLAKEGITKGVYLTGDVMVDALNYNKNLAEKKSKILEKLNLKSKEYMVATVHRPSNTDSKKKLSNIVEAFCSVDETIVFPVHPRTFKFLKAYNLYNKLQEKVNIIKPVGYLDFIKLMNHSKKILTDSGGVQKEAYIFKVPCVTLRETTEWVETVKDGWNILVGSDKKKIVEAIHEFEPKEKQRDVFGKGDASEMIRKIIGVHNENMLSCRYRKYSHSALG